MLLLKILCLALAICPALAHAATPTPSTTATLTPTSSPSPTITPTFTVSATFTPALAATAIAAAAAKGTGPFIYPDPASATEAFLGVQMNGPGTVTLRIYNAAAEPAAILRQALASGADEVPLDLKQFRPGVYFYTVDLLYDDGQGRSFGLKKFRVKP